MKKLHLHTLFVLSIVLLMLGCSGKRREDPILQLSAEEALEIGKELMAQNKHYRASQHLTHAFEVEPNSRNGREALLLAADALYLHGGSDNYIRCEAKYRDFLNRFPTSNRADYAQLQVANCLAKRSEKPDRDQQMTRKALQAYEELLRLYPTSSHIPEARQKIREVTDLLAEHELVIGEFYLKYGRGVLCAAAIQRFEFLREQFPDFSRMDTNLHHLAVAYRRCERDDEAEGAITELRERYPGSPYLEALSKHRDKVSRRADKSGERRAKG